MPRDETVEVRSAKSAPAKKRLHIIDRYPHHRYGEIAIYGASLGSASHDPWHRTIYVETEEKTEWKRKYVHADRSFRSVGAMEGEVLACSRAGVLVCCPVLCCAVLGVVCTYSSRMFVDPEDRLRALIIDGYRTIRAEASRARACENFTSNPPCLKGKPERVGGSAFVGWLAAELGGVLSLMMMAAAVGGSECTPRFARLAVLRRGRHRPPTYQSHLGANPSKPKDPSSSPKLKGSHLMHARCSHSTRPGSACRRHLKPCSLAREMMLSVLSGCISVYL